MPVTPEPFFPVTFESWTTVGANLVAMGAAISIAVILQLNLRLSVYFQRRTAAAQEMAAQAAKSQNTTYVDPKNEILNNVFLWANTRHESQNGLSPDEFSKLSRTARKDYVLWVSRLVAALDIVFVSGGGISETSEAKIEQTLAQHAPALMTGWPVRRIRFPVSDRMSALIRRAHERRGNRSNHGS